MEIVSDLGGKVLIAMPAMTDPRFERSVILICAHSGDGTMGLIVNKPSADLTLAGLLDHLNIPRAPKGREIGVHIGGPVERGRGFVLHSHDYPMGPATMQVPGGFRLTATLNILEAMARGDGPTSALLALGYTGWGPGQIEGEIRRSDWLIADASPDLIFAADDGRKWAGALGTLGINPLTLSSVVGRA